MKKFLEEVKSEFGKVVWPSREQVQNATAVVIVLSVAMALYLGVFDLVFSKLLDNLINVVS